MVLIFLGTLAQVHFGIHAVQAKYFQSLFVFWSPTGASWKIPILPGGYLLGTVLLINLIAAHATRFQFSKKKAGIILLHLGVILLLVGQLLTGLFARETQMRIDEGQTLGYSEASREVELAVIDVNNPDFDQVVAIPEAALARGGTIQNADAALHSADQTLRPELAPRDAHAGPGRAAFPRHHRFRHEHGGHGNPAHGQG